MRRLPRFAVRLVLPLTLLAPRAAAPAADEPPRLKTQVVKLKLAADGPRRERAPAIELIQLPPGKITLAGADGGGHDFEIKPIWIAKFETRWDEYDVFWQRVDVDVEPGVRVARAYHPPYGGRDPATRGDGDWGVEGYPANCIHLKAALKYCAWLSKNTGRKFRLPTEAEWEYACRAGGPPVAPDAKALDALAWFAGNSGKKTHPVGRKRPNPWGLHDMLGNVGEYVVRDPTDTKGLLAGGSYEGEAKDVRSDAREPYSPDWQRTDPETPSSDEWLFWDVHHVGFRVVMEE
jgi:formylglycine-generating enzyme required for sulfatase activity